MAVKTVSSRASIIGRGAKCRGRSAVEQSAYISRTTIYSEYYGQKYYPKYAEDLVSTGVMLPDHAPREYLDHSRLWNSVEMVEKHAKAQLCRLLKFSLPNWMSYELADKVMRDYIQRNFTDKGMCAEYAIHDSVNGDGQHNLHVHILLTMRPILENGEWGDKKKKVYELDGNGERIPVIDKKTGEQKVDGQNRKQWKCRTVPSTDWNDKGNAKKWRQDMVETINRTAAALGVENEVWEYRSFAERGLAIKPTIHLGEKAAALERKGIQTDRGNYNREVGYLNSLIVRATELRRESLDKLFNGIHKSAAAARNEVISLIRKAASKNGRLSLPIVKSKYFAKVSNRQAVSSQQAAADFVMKNGIETFAQLDDYIKDHSKRADSKDTAVKSRWRRVQDLKELAAAYAEYSRLRDVMKESQSLSGISKLKYDKAHKEQIEAFPDAKERFLSLNGEGAKATPKAWAKEIEQLGGEIPKLQKEYAEEVSGLATAEVIQYTKKDMERIEANESRRQSREQAVNQAVGKPKRREEEI